VRDGLDLDPVAVQPFARCGCSQHLTQAPRAFLPFTRTHVHTPAPVLALLGTGEFLQVLQSEQGQTLLTHTGGGLDGAGGAVEQVVERTCRTNAAAYLAGATDIADARVRTETVLYVGVAALQLFRQANWTGPPVNPKEVEAVLGIAAKPTPAAPVACPAGGGSAEPDRATYNEGVSQVAGEEHARQAQGVYSHATEAPLPNPSKEKAMLGLIDALTVDGETAFRLTRVPGLLLVARGLLQLAADPAAAAVLVAGGGAAAGTFECSPPKSAGVWLARCLYAHQQLLESPVRTPFTFI
jgi:hypothetical protein